MQGHWVLGIVWVTCHARDERPSGAATAASSLDVELHAHAGLVLCGHAFWALCLARPTPRSLGAPSTKLARQPIRVLDGAEKFEHDLLDRTEVGSTGALNWIEAVKYLVRPRLGSSRYPDLSTLLALHRTPVVALSLGRACCCRFSPSDPSECDCEADRPSPCRRTRPAGR